MKDPYLATPATDSWWQTWHVQSVRPGTTLR